MIKFESALDLALYVIADMPDEVSAGELADMIIQRDTELLEPWKERVATLEGQLAKARDRRFPILQPPKGGLRSIPWAMIAPQEAQAIDNHDQTLERLAERGGLGATEAIAVLRGVSYRVVRGISEEYAMTELRQLVKEFEDR